MRVRRLGPSDLDWAAGRLARRRAALVPFAPVFWRPSVDAEQRHREFLTSLLENGAVGFRTDDDLVLAHPRGDGWVVDDAAVAADRWESAGRALWEATSGEVSGPVRWVCPVPEPARLAFVRRQGFEVVESWWHHDTAGPLAAPHPDPDISGAHARLVPAPPVYAPGGPILFLTRVADPAAALVDARARAAGLGAPVVVVGQQSGEAHLVSALESAGFVRHCDFLESASG